MQDVTRVRVLERAELLAGRCYEVAAMLPVTERYGLRAQIQRAGVSVAANIAEGVGRGTDGDLERFLRIAAGSETELATLLRIASRVHEAVRETITPTIRDAQMVSRMLNRFINTVAHARRHPPAKSE